MTIRKSLFSLALSVGIFLFTFQSSAQTRTVGAFMVDETELYAMTKQMSQFFSRFNNEEDQFGKKYHFNSPEYRNNEKRKQLLPLLFDKENLRTSSALKDFFIDDLTTPKDTNFMEFLGGRWYSEVSATFEFQGKTVNIIMILMIEKERLGSKWVLTNVYFPTFNRMFPAGEIAEREKHFLHPMSHELDFMNIHKAFRQPEVIDYYASNNFRPDYLSLFFYEVKLGRLKFVKIDELKFHIFQINNWYFEVSWFNRKGNNSGWLISNLMYVTELEKESLLKFYEP
ncbi:MAG: hypothetical protein Q8J88_10735 [Bacteroidales bacterium]|nr:hypothetical protein [Bacteroidales bacterium]